jgi:2-C-methyl-D-erythritol 2,4-cyclodiphosphate synthase
MFPNTDPAFKNIDSQKLLQRVVAEVTKLGFDVVNLDATLIAEKPKIQSRVAEMKAVLAKSAGLMTDEIGVKATTNEGVGDLGRGLAIAAHAVAMLGKR